MRWLETVPAHGIWLRPWRITDAPAVEAVRGDAFVARWSNMANETAADWLARQRSRADGVSLAVSTELDDVAIGRVALRRADDCAATAELSYWLVPSVRGRGLAAAASLALCEWGFTRLGLGTVHIDIDVDNTASRGVARTLAAIRAPELDHTEVDRAGVRRQLLGWTLLRRSALTCDLHG